MKEEFRTRLWLLIPAMLLMIMVSALMSSVTTYAGTVRISQSEAELFTNGGRKKLRLYVTDDYRAVPAQWKSTKRKVATVNSNGLVKAKRTGWTTILGYYNGQIVACRIHVRKVSGLYKRSLKAYKKFLTRPYVTYTDDGKYDQADEFNAIDLDMNGIPELLVNVYDANRNQYYVVYHYTRSGMSTGQRLGICNNFIWYPVPNILSYIKYEPYQSLTIYSRDNGVSLNSLAVDVTHTTGGHTYYESRPDGKNPFYRHMSAVNFRNYVDHDLLGYNAAVAVTMHVNTPANRDRYIK